MTPGTIFISHRAEYGGLVQSLKKAIETTSRGKIQVFISEQLRGAEEWRDSIKSRLADSQYLFLIYGAPHEDWSWCFYEAGFFAGASVGQKDLRRIYCIARPNVPAPGPLSDLQLVTDTEGLLQDLFQIYDDNRIEYNPAQIRQTVSEIGGRLFRQLEEFVSYPRVAFVLKEGDLVCGDEIPSGATLRGDRVYLNQLFGIGREEIAWEDIVRAASDAGRTPQEQLFYSKWVEETKKIILDARRNRFRPPQAVLVTRSGLRVRFLPFQARLQGDGVYWCEFLVIDEVGGPTLGLPPHLNALLTSLRLAVRFRYDLIRRFADTPDRLSEAERQARIEEIPRIIDSLTSESFSRGNMSIVDLQAAFDDDADADRIGRLTSFWPFLKEQLYSSLGLAEDGRKISNQGLIGPNLTRYRLALDSLRLVNLEFLSLCCARVSQRMTRSPEELRMGAEALERNLNALGETPAAA